MISITPQGSIYLCKTPLENDYNNQLTFANATSQQSYFAGKVQKIENDYTYIKKDNQIVVGIPIDTIIDCNYLFYKNTSFTNKFYYCFITNMEYVNENATRITIEVDVWQTYMFDIVKKACFVEREHVNDDTIGLHTLPEGLETGEFMVNELEYLDQFANDYYLVCGVSKLTEQMAEDNYGTPFGLTNKIYSGIYSGLTYILFQTADDLTKFLLTCDGQGIAEAVYSVFIIPKSIYPQSTITYTSVTEDATFEWKDFTFDVQYTFSYKLMPNSSVETTMVQNKTISINTSLGSYTPKNNKMFTGEFNYLYVTNNAGNDAKYNYEDFYNNTPTFNIIGAITPGCSIRLIPQNYKNYNEGEQYDEFNSYGLSGAKYPICSWSSDSYTNWLTQQSVNITQEKMFNVGSAMLGIATGQPLMTGLALVNTIKETMGLRYQREFTPNQIKGCVNSGDVIFSSSNQDFQVYKMSVKPEYAKIIDDYFSMFGYKVNEVKIPNIEGRTYWNYVKTLNCNFEGDIPQIYLNKIKEIFNNGITLWHDPTKFLDYSQSNTIVTPTP